MAIRLAPQAWTALEELPPQVRARLRKAISSLAGGPRPAGADVKRLQGSRFYRLRVGEYRIVYASDGGLTTVERVFHRSDGYGWLERMG